MHKAFTDCHFKRNGSPKSYSIKEAKSRSDQSEKPELDLYKTN